MKVKDIKYLTDEQENINAHENIKVEIKGLGPTIRVLRKCKIIVTNKRIFIAQKMLFSSKYLVQYIIWYNNSKSEKIHFTRGLIETNISENGIKELNFKEKKIIELIINNKFLENIKIFMPKDKLFNL